MKKATKVDFVLIGAMKCATSSLSAILSSHPDVQFLNPHEPNYFLHPSLDASDKKTIRYHKFFDPKMLGIWGERSTAYSKNLHLSAEVAQRMFAYNRDMKIIYMVRDPIERLISNYLHLYQKGHISCELAKSIDRHRELVEGGLYASQIRPYIEKFGRHRILFINFHQFSKDKKQALTDVSHFLDIDIDGFRDYANIHLNRSIGENITPHQFDHLVKSKVGKIIRNIINPSTGRKFLVYLTNHQKRMYSQKPILDPETCSRLVEIFAPEMEKLEQLTGWNLGAWYQKNEQSWNQ